MSVAEPIVEQLRNGDHLDRLTFHARYHQMPARFRAELIRGVVFVPSPMMSPHGEFTHLIQNWLGNYWPFTPGTKGWGELTVILSDEDEPQPDAAMILLPEAGDNTRINDENYLEGPPELVVEVAHPSEAIDLNEKRDAYERAGVCEYLVVCLREQELRSFRNEGGVFANPAAMSSGIWKSQTFPGLWLDVAALFESRLDRVYQTLAQGMQSAEYASFRDQMEQRLREPS